MVYNNSRRNKPTAARPYPKRTVFIMMKSYTAYCMNEDGENLCMTREYTAKAHFISDLHGNGYKVHFVALTDKYDEECAKYYERLETKRRRAAIHRQCEREWREHDKKFAEELEKRLAAEEETAEEPAAEELIEAVNELCERTANSRAEVAQMIEETENMIKEQAEALQEARVKDFEAVKPQLFAKVEHITADFPSKSEIVYRIHGEDIAHTIWIDNGVNPPERLSRAALDSWEKSGIVEERHIFEIAMENTMAKQKPRIHAGTMFYNPDADSLSNSALLESCFNRQNLDKHSDILVTTSEQNNGAIALFYPPVCEKICELLHGAGFYVAFTSKNEGIIHKLDHLEVSAIRRNLQSTNRMFNPADTLTDEVFYYDPIIKRLIPESKTADFEVLRRQVLKGFA